MTGGRSGRPVPCTTGVRSQPSDRWTYRMMQSVTLSVFAGGLAVLLAGAALCACLGSRRWAGWIGVAAAVAGCAAAGWAGAWALLAGQAFGVALDWQGVPLCTLRFGLDPLTGFFTVVIALLGVLGAVYAVGYWGESVGCVAGRAGGTPAPQGVGGTPVAQGAGGTLAPQGRWALGLGWAEYLVLVAAMFAVVAARDGVAFLVAWEVMALSSFLLVMYERERPETLSAGWVYLAAAHLGAACLLAMFLVLGREAGAMDFAALGRSAAGGALAPGLATAVFVLALVGFGSKAGLVPMHVWLPEAHPAAPSHVSALMSGVMIKMGIYGLIRVGWELAAPGPSWWGALVLALGCVSAVLGVLYALMEHDLKRLLAYHSVENIGIIMMGLGAALLLSALGYPGAAALGLLAGLYHVLNHAVFKALLFLGAGAVQQSAGTRDLEKLGGLIRRMPWTAATFLVGSAAISALPPLNGFVSEWLTFQSLLALSAAGPGLALGAVAAVGLLALTGGLAAFCFVKAFGITFLGMPRSEKVGEAREAALSMRLAMVFLAAVCFALGLFPTFVAGLLAPVTIALVGVAAQPSLSLGLLAAPPRGGTLAPLALIGFLAALLGLAMLLGRMIGGPGRSRVAPPWGCGIDLEPSMQYTATALATPIRIIFRSLVRPHQDVKRQYREGIAYFVSGVRYEGGVHPVYEHFLYAPAVRMALALSRRIRLMQNGSLRTYLAYLCGTLVAVLLLTR